jgi:hypothetical protein
MELIKGPFTPAFYVITPSSLLKPRPLLGQLTTHIRRRKTAPTLLNTYLFEDLIVFDILWSPVPRRSMYGHGTNLIIIKTIKTKRIGLGSQLAETELKMKMSGTLLHPLAANGSWARNEEDPQKYLLRRIEICPRRLLRKSVHAQGTPLAALVTLKIGKNASHGQMPIQIT